MRLVLQVQSRANVGGHVFKMATIGYSIRCETSPDLLQHI